MLKSSRDAARTVVVSFLFVLAAGAAAAGTIDVAWDPVSHSDLAGYRVYWGTSSGTYPQSFDVGVTTAAQISGLNDCTTYYVAVKARDSAGNLSPTYSNEITGWARPQVLGASPSTVDLNTTLDLTISGWNFQSGASVAFSDPAISVNNVTVSSCSQIVANVTIGGSASLGGVDVDVTNPDTVFGAGSSLFSVVSDTGAPSISALQASSVGSTTATISWTTDEPADGQVFFRKSGGVNYQSSALDPTLLTGHSIGLFGLTPSATYEYYVSSSDSSGNGATSPVQTFSTQSNGFTYMTFEAEAGPVTSPLQISTDVAAFEGESLQVQNGTQQGTTTNPAGSKDFGVDVPQAGNWNVWFRMRGPSSNALSWFWSANGAPFEVIAPSVASQWEWVAGSQVTLTQGLNVITLGGRDARAKVDRILVTDDPSFQPSEVPDADTTAPSTPTNLLAGSISGEVSLTWTNSSSGDLDRVIVRYRTDGVSPVSPYDGFGLVDRTATPGGADSFVHSGLTNGVTYFYSVFAVDGAGNVSDAATASGTPSAAPLGEVTNVHRTDTTGSP